HYATPTKLPPREPAHVSPDLCTSRSGTWSGLDTAGGCSAWGRRERQGPLQGLSPMPPGRSCRQERYRTDPKWGRRDQGGHYCRLYLLRGKQGGWDQGLGLDRGQPLQVPSESRDIYAGQQDDLCGHEG